MFDEVFPEEIKINILSRLPAKSIGRFRCISKQWRNLLSQPYFIKTHLNLAKDCGQQQGLLLKSCSSRPDAVYSVSLSNAHQVFDEITVSASRLHFPGIPDSWSVVSSSCDGLLLGTDHRYCLFVMNPTTREIRNVPSLPYDFDQKDVKYGLGYDSVRDDYKVVVHISDYSDSHVPGAPGTFLYVYSFRNGVWKKYKCPYFTADYQVGCFLHGHIYWIGVFDDSWKPGIVDFDLENEVICYVPHHYEYVCLTPCWIVVIGERLWVTDLRENFRVREEYGDGEESWRTWTNWGVEGSGIWTDTTIFEDPYFSTIPEWRFKRPLFLSGKDAMVWRIGRRFGIYNFKGEALKKIVVRGVEDYLLAATYTETLVSPNKIATGRG